LYSGVAALASGAVAFTDTEWRTDGSSKSVLQVFDPQSPVPPRKIADVAADAQGPAWTAGDVVAYIGPTPEMLLLVTNLGNQTTRRIDTGVESFAWQP
jgi:TolB protein